MPSEKTLEGEHELERMLERYPPISSSPDLDALNDLPPVPGHVPSMARDGKMMKTDDSTIKELSESTSPQASQPNALPDSNASKASITQPPSSNISLSSHHSPVIHLPPRSDNVFPQTAQVAPRELAKWITRKDNPASILLLDVRPRDMFRQACIKHKWMVQIEPLVLRKE